MDSNTVVAIVGFIAIVVCAALAIWVKSNGDKKLALVELERLLGILFAALIVQAKGEMASISDDQVKALAYFTYDNLTGLLPPPIAIVIRGMYGRDTFAAAVLEEWRKLQMAQAYTITALAMKATAKK